MSALLLLLRLAVRNLRRNTRRTLITSAGIALGLALMAAVNTLQEGAHQDMVRTAVSLMAGHVVVQAPGWQEEPDAAKVVTGSAEVAAALRQALPKASVGRRLFVDGLLTSPAGSAGVALRGVEPEAEAAVVEFDEQVKQGAWLTPGDTHGIVIGEAMAKSLAVGVGDKVVFLAQPDGDEVQSQLFRVRGVFRTGAAEFDGVFAFADLAAAQAVYVAADPATQVAVHLPPGEDAAAAWSAAKAALPATPLEVLPWEDAIPEVRQYVELDSAYSDGMFLVLGLIVSMGVVNTVLMSVMERVRELGIMMAVGMRPGRLAAMVLLEGFVLGAVSALVGMALGLLLSWPLITHGVDYSEMMGGETMEAAGLPLHLKVYGIIDWPRFAFYPLLGVFFALLASAWPAWKVAHLSPVQAIHHR